MSKKQRRRKHAATQAQAGPPPAPGVRRRITGWILLLIAIAASAILVLHHLAGMRLPGCGPGSPCARAQDSVWGTIPLLEWPVSYAGLAYFIAMAVGWFWVTRHGAARRFVAVARAGLAASFLFLGIMLVEGYLCPYCVAAHLANIGFVICLGRARIGDHPDWTPLPRVLTAGVVMTLFLVAAENTTREVVEKEAVELADASVQQVLARQPSETKLYRGRFTRGAERARQRILVITDYQCPHCKRVEAELSAVMQRRNDVSVSVMHFPFCADCNEVARKRGFSPHANACRAARAAEAAGMVGGAEGFWAMHRWLFSVDGEFTDEALRAEVNARGYPVETFFASMNGDETLALIQGDVRVGMELGLHFTPMVFINGVEIRGTQAPDIVPRAVEGVAAGQPPALTWEEAADVPAGVEEKLVTDWQNGRRLNLPDDAVARVIVDPQGEPRIDVVVWGDYLEAGTIRADEMVRSLAVPGSGIRYTFRHYPFDQDCNPNLSRTFHPNACFASRLAEAAGVVGGDEAYVAMHDYLVRTLGTFEPKATAEAAMAIRIPAADLVGMMKSPEVEDALREDIEAGRQLGLRAIPAIFINDRRVPRWKVDDTPRLDLFFDAVAD